MNKVLTDILNRPVPDGLTSSKVRELIKKVEEFDTNPKMVYSAGGEKILKELSKYGAKDIPQNYRGVLLEHWLELLSQTQETIAEAPRPTGQEATTLTSDQFANFDKDVERIKESEKIRANQKQVTESFEKRGKEIFEEQQRIQEQILKSKTAEPEIEKLKGWNIKVDEIEKTQLTPKEKVVFDEYKNEINNTTKIVDTDEREEKVNQIKIDLAREIHERAESALKAQGLEKEELDFVVNKTAEKIVVEIQKSETPGYLPPLAQLAIHSAVLEKVKTLPSTVVSTQAKEALLSSIGTTTKFRILPDVYLESVARVAFGPDFSRVVFGSKYNISISDTPNQEYVYSFNFTQANLEGRQIQSQQNQTLEKFKSLGTQEAKTFLFDTAATQFSRTQTGTKILSSSPKAQVAFYSVFKGAGQTVTWTSEGFLGNAVLRFAPEYAPLLNIATGTKFVTPIMSMSGGAIGAGMAAQTAATTASVTFTGGIMAGEAFAGGAGAAAAGAAAGSTVAPIVGTVIGAAIGAVFGKVMEKLPQIKKWFSENGWIFGVGAGIGGAMLFGAGPGLAIGIVATGATVGFGTLATGLFNILGYIGRSVGIVIATPVIVTLLVIPPLVAFIMLVINNSAYIVPPSLNESAIGKITSPYIDIVKTASPSGPLKNTDLPEKVTYTVTIKAKKDSLTSIKIKDSCQVISKDVNTCPKFAIPDVPATISPTTPFTFTYTGDLDKELNDSVIINTITVTADTVGQSAAVAETSYSLTIGNPPISCPVPGAKPDNSMNYSYNSSNDTGHGSKPYWSAMGSSYSYALPQSTGCMKPGDCPYYGYAFDVFPNGTTEVFAPSVLGKDTTWSCSYAFSNGGGSAGHTFHCTSSDGNYLLVLTHMNKNAKTGKIKSGEKIGSLYNQGGNTHLHLEFQLGGSWKKPEDYFCK